MLSCDGIRKVTHATSRQPLQSLNLLAVLCLVQSSESLKIDIGSCWISGVDVDPCRVRERKRGKFNCSICKRAAELGPAWADPDVFRQETSENV